ncbi:hypothetical protein B0H16DRAFT_1492409, partial [Mycena metata]
MQQPKSGSACDFLRCWDRRQKFLDGTFLSDEEIERPSKSWLRCSRCKNQFYCSADCQKNDWKEHKWNCSLLPVDELPAATVVVDDDFKAEVTRVVAILKEMAAALKVEKNLSVEMFAPLLKITSEVPDRFHYKRAIQDSDKFNYRPPLIAACRLLLIDYVSTLDEAGRQEYEKYLARADYPTAPDMPYRKMYAPKIVARPADLSPGEYHMVVKVMPIFATGEMEKAKKKKQMEKDAAEKKAGGSKGEQEGNAAEEGEGFRMQWVSLAVLTTRLYSA